MSPERVDERLQLLATVDRIDEPPTRKKLQDLRAEFLEATKPGPILQLPQPHSSDDPIHVTGMTEASDRPSTAQKFVDLPLDVFPDIASLVYPLDLIHLSRTNKTLRGVLMSRGSRAIWRAALSRAEDFPPCPKDMSEPLYAALVFDQHCFGCGIHSAFWVDYALRIRMCERCYQENVVEGTEILKSLPQKYREIVSQVALMLIPSTQPSQVGQNFHRLDPLSHHMQDFYLKYELEAVLHLFWPLPEPEEITGLQSFVRARVDNVMLRQTHAFFVHMWDNVGTCPDYKQRKIAFYTFRAFFREDAILMLRGVTSTQWDPVASEYVESEVPEPQVDAPPPPQAKCIKQCIIEKMALQQRFREEHRRRVAGRYAQLADWYPRVLAAHFSGLQWDNAVLPNAFDGARLWTKLVLDDDGCSLIDADTVMAEQQLRDVEKGLKAYPKRAMAYLARAVKATESRDSDPPSRDDGTRKDVVSGEDACDILLRPTALFRCEKCGDYPFAWPEVNVHWQDKHPEESVWEDSGDNVYRAAVWEGVEMVGSCKTR